MAVLGESLVGRYSYYLLRGGARSLRQVFALLVGFSVLLAYLLSGDDYPRALTWSRKAKYKLPDDLRIVVFGSQDPLGSANNDAYSRTTWPQHLCRELKCSSLISLIPSLEFPPGLTSNAIYDSSLREIAKQNEVADIAAVPADDQFYVVEQYPVPKTPDLVAQVQRFLSMRAPEKASRETLWVFSFGTWDIWNLAALPRNLSEAIVDDSVALLFEQIELLYRKSLNPNSIASSDFWSRVPNEDLHALTHPGTAKEVDLRKVEGFRVLIPEILDITLLPGWQKRPLPPMPYTRSTELRNAASLTNRWNHQVSESLEDWRRRENEKPDNVEEEGIAMVDFMPSAPMRRHQRRGAKDEDKDKDNGEAKGDNGESRVVYAPYPFRVGLHATFISTILSAMMNQNMQESGEKDGRGRGTLKPGDPMRYLDVRTPCVAGTGIGNASAAMNTTSIKCDAPNDHLFYDDFTLGEGASKQLAQKAVEYLFDQHVF